MAKKKYDEMRKEAKKSQLMSMKKSALDKHQGPMGKKLQVSVASPTKEGLKKGLDTAKDFLAKRREFRYGGIGGPSYKDPKSGQKDVKGNGRPGLDFAESNEKLKKLGKYADGGFKGDADNIKIPSLARKKKVLKSPNTSISKGKKYGDGGGKYIAGEEEVRQAEREEAENLKRMREAKKKKGPQDSSKTKSALRSLLNQFKR